MKTIYKLIQASILGLLLSVVSYSLLADVYNKLPRDIDDLIQSSDIIVIGNIGEIVDKRLFYGYQADAAEMEEKEKITPFTLGLPLVDYRINVQEIIKDNSGNGLSHVHNTATNIIYRTFEDHELINSDSAVKERKGKKIYFLTKNPDNETYGIVSLAHKIDLEKANGGITYSFENKDDEVPFAPKVMANDFIKEVKKKITDSSF